MYFKDTRHCLHARVRTLFLAIVCVCLGAAVAFSVLSYDRVLLCPSRSVRQLPHSSQSTFVERNDNFSDTSAFLAGFAATPWLPLKLDGRKDVLVNLHIQKTGGSDFLAHVVTSKQKGKALCYQPDELLRRVSKKKKSFVVCPASAMENCVPAVPSSGSRFTLPEMWLACEKTYGWVCGIHPFLTEMRKCLPKYLSENYGRRGRRLHFMTLLRHPVSRYISEFLHVRRGGKWTYTHQCGNHLVTAKDVPACYPGFYEGETWGNVTLEEYMACDSNWANNRQTIMLADLEAVGCFGKSNLSADERDHILLQSAKKNLEQFSFVGLSEYMTENGILFEHRFGIELEDPSMQKKLQYQHSGPLLQQVWNNSTLFSAIASLNNLDMELYHYAKKLFVSRLNQIKVKIDFDRLDKDIHALKVNESSSYFKRYSRMRRDGLLK